jgi:small subunit ribosomal protein S9
VAAVKPGNGKITINGKPMLEYFLMPRQRWQILKPLILTQYTCLLDIELTIRGGGTTGQAESAIPAIAKALQNFDVENRRILKPYGLLKHDIRRVERKKYGKKKARKGRVYKRR